MLCTPAGKRSRRVGIVAVARKLYVLLWRYVTQGVVPDGVATDSVALKKKAQLRGLPQCRSAKPPRLLICSSLLRTCAPGTASFDS